MDKQAEIARIQAEYEAKNREIDKQHLQAMGRIGLGSLLTGASALPIFNIPYVGTGLGGALYELGQGIAEGDKMPELAKRTGQGFAVGETVGAIPYVGKFAGKTKAGQAVGNQASKLYNYLADTKVGQKVAEIAPKVEDALMTDIKAYNPFKKTQTAYHGSPYDFNKFSNEAIGTGEGAQAHGMGHYSALDKDIADTRYREGVLAQKGGTKWLLDGKELPKDWVYPNGYSSGFYAPALYREIEQDGIEKTLQKVQNELSNKINEVAKFEKMYDKGTIEEIPQLSNKYDYLLSEVKSFNSQIDFLKNNLGKKITKDEGQLYKLSIPKDDVMLREDYSYNKQPQKVKKALDDILNKQLKEKNIKNLGIDTQTSPGTIERTLHTYKYYPGTDAGHIYDIINNNNNATEIFNNAGIKGISYNGGIDGEARVIFNPNDIEIVRKYYNQPSLGEMLVKKAPNAGATSNYLYDLMTRK